MNAKELARVFVDQLSGISEFSTYSHISRISLIVGSAYEISAEDLEQEFEDLLEDLPGKKIDGAVVSVKVVALGDTYEMTSRDDEHIATGWEMLVTNLKGME